jgi:hypothetical protein
MELRENWAQVRETFEASIKSSLHCAIATITPEGEPYVTPIGHVFLRDDCSAFYFEEHPRQLPENLSHNPRVCLLLVNSGRWFWLSSLVRGRFATPPGVRLMGTAGPRRRASEREQDAYRRRTSAFRSLKGYALIWQDLSYVRDVTIDGFAPILYPTMTDGLWR